MAGINRRRTSIQPLAAPIRVRLTAGDPLWLLGVTRYDLSCLLQFEGRKALWRIGGAILVRCGPPLLTLLGFAAGIYAGVNLDVPRLSAAATIFLGATAAASWTARRATWRALILDRLASYEEVNPNRFTPVLLSARDLDQAYSALRRVRLFPGPWFNQPAQIEGATELTARLNVSEPLAWPQTETYDDFLILIATTLARAGLRGRAASFDAFPDGTFSRWDAPLH
jgi:hypothetical protein